MWIGWNFQFSQRLNHKPDRTPAAEPIMMHTVMLVKSVAITAMRTSAPASALDDGERQSQAFIMTCSRAQYAAYDNACERAG